MLSAFTVSGTGIILIHICPPMLNIHGCIVFSKNNIQTCYCSHDTFFPINEYEKFITMCNFFYFKRSHPCLNTFGTCPPTDGT